MKKHQFRRTVLIGGIALTMSLLTACSSSFGGAEQIPAALPAGAEFTPDADAMTAPAVSGALIDGTPVELADLWADRVLVLQFTASWCTQCVDAEADLAQIAEDYDGAVLPVRIALDESDEKIMKYLSTSEAVGPAIVDRSGSIWRDYAVTEPPATAIVDTAGGLVRLWSGGADEETLRGVLDELVARD